MSAIQRRDLEAQGTLIELGRGNEGIVYGIPGDSSRVYKEYTSDCSTGPSEQALESLIQVREGLPDADKSWLDQRAAWPQQVVHDGSRMVGFTMEPLPAALYRQYGMRNSPRQVVCSWMYLAMKDPAATNPLLADGIPNAWFDVIRDAGHAAHLEQPAATVDTIAAWLTST